MSAPVRFPTPCSRRIKSLLLGASLSLTLLLSSLGALPVSAERVQRGLDDFSNTCADIQDQGRRLVNEYYQIGSTNPQDPRLAGILQQIRSNGLLWQQVGCQGVYGDISYLRLPTSPLVPRPVAPISGRLAN